MRPRAAVTATGLALAAGCLHSTQGDDRGDPRACRQTYEFGNTGCADVAGEVVGLRGQPLATISVGPGNSERSDGLNTTYADTDVEGLFALRLTRFGPKPPWAAIGPDTVSLYVRAADPRTAGVGIPARVRDSVLVRLTVAPVGAVPEPSTVRIVLDVP
jgi:hypothetical protein